MVAALKATDPRSGLSSVVTTELYPRGYDAAPAVTLRASGVAGQALSADFQVDAANGVDCCSAEWDSDGDGDYDDGTGAFPAVTASEGEQTIGVRVTDAIGRSAFVRKTFTVDAAPPVVGKMVVNPLTLSVRVGSVKLAKLLSSGLRVTPGCAQACSATVVVAGDKATASRLKPRLTQLGKASGKSRTLTVRLSANARKALRRARSVKLKVTVSATATGGRAGTAAKAVTIRR